jgi:hypothetical protein
MDLTREEAEFLQDRITLSHPRSLLALLAKRNSPTEERFPWSHPDSAAFRPEHQLLLHHGRLFSEMKYSSALLYNLLLAETAKSNKWMEAHRADLERWQEELDRSAVQAWNLSQLWELTLNRGHTISPVTRRFVEEWVGFVLEGRSLADHKRARQAVYQRETTLKGTRSKFLNPRALVETWKGEAGTGWLDYRWFRVQVLLNDLYYGLARA